jgi:hypothetical protein
LLTLQLDFATSSRCSITGILHPSPLFQLLNTRIQIILQLQPVTSSTNPHPAPAPSYITITMAVPNPPKPVLPSPHSHNQTKSGPSSSSPSQLTASSLPSFTTINSFNPHTSPSPPELQSTTMAALCQFHCQTMASAVNSIIATTSIPLLHLQSPIQFTCNFTKYTTTTHSNHQSINKSITQLIAGRELPNSMKPKLGFSLLCSAGVTPSIQPHLCNSRDATDITKDTR